jgi:hypothetical protein
MKPWKVQEIKSEMKREGVKNIRIYHGPLKLLPAAEVRLSNNIHEKRLTLERLLSSEEAFGQIRIVTLGFLRLQDFHQIRLS